MSRAVPNEPPSADPGALRLALIGEAPGAEEVAQGKPFCGVSGWRLNAWLAQCGVSRAQVFAGNVCQFKPSPSSNDFHLFGWNEARVQEGIAALREDLARFRPHIVVALGNAAFHLLRHGNTPPPKSKKLGFFQWPSKVGVWRGSLLRASAAFDEHEATAIREAGPRGALWSSSSTEERRSTQLGRNPEDGRAVAAFDSPSAPPVSSPRPNGHAERREATHGSALADAVPLSHSAASAAVCAANSDSPPSLLAEGASSLTPSREPSTPLRENERLGVGASPVPCEARAGASLSASGEALAPFPVYKVVATYHPAATFRDPSFTFPLVNDLKRAVVEARSPELVLPERNIEWDLPVEVIEVKCEAIRFVKQPVGFDIEGGLGGLQCCSFATTPHDAFVVDLMERGHDYARKIAAIASVLEDAAVPKVLWNAAYERAILEATASITMCAYEDGMLAWWEKWSELPKGLDFVASILTREPYWAEGIGWDKKTGLPRVMGRRFWEYNGLDSCVTLEIWQHPLIRAAAESRTPVAFTV